MPASFFSFALYSHCARCSYGSWSTQQRPAMLRKWWARHCPAAPRSAARRRPQPAPRPRAKPRPKPDPTPLRGHTRNGRREWGEERRMLAREKAGRETGGRTAPNPPTEPLSRRSLQPPRPPPPRDHPRTARDSPTRALTPSRGPPMTPSQKTKPLKRSGASRKPPGASWETSVTHPEALQDPPGHPKSAQDHPQAPPPP